MKLYGHSQSSSFPPRRFVIPTPAVRHSHPGWPDSNDELFSLITIKGLRLIFSWLIEVHKVYLQCKAWLSSYCSFCVIMNSLKVRHSRPGRRYINIWALLLYTWRRALHRLVAVTECCVPIIQQQCFEFECWSAVKNLCIWYYEPWINKLT